MNLSEMKEHMSKIVVTVLQKYAGGEKFFTEVDAMVKNDPRLLISYYQWIHKDSNNPIILSGEIGEVYLSLCEQKILFDFPMVIVNGGLRTGSEIISIKKYPSGHKFLQGTKFMMIDDSYYSGKTVQKVDEFLHYKGYILDDIYVFYDGSKENKNNVKSLYRYYS